jgi:hypothetical protein
MLTYADLSERVNKLVTKRDREWCGVPMPMPGNPIEIESRNPWREKLKPVMEMMNPPKPDSEFEPEANIVNQWFSERLNMEVGIMKHEGRYRPFKHSHRYARRVGRLLRTIGASQAWNLEVELRAIDTLETLVKPHIMEMYVLTGMMLETSKRSGLTYVFRRLAPTIVLTPRGPADRPDQNEMRTLCALCLHPIGYYTNTHAGAMVPTDDVIAHLLMMRGDEHLFWKRSNQHSTHSPEAAVAF